MQTEREAIEMRNEDRSGVIVSKDVYLSRLPSSTSVFRTPSSLIARQSSMGS